MGRRISSQKKKQANFQYRLALAKSIDNRYGMDNTCLLGQETDR